jgi:type I restriction enzyme R subunit
MTSANPRRAHRGRSFNEDVVEDAFCDMLRDAGYPDAVDGRALPLEGPDALRATNQEVLFAPDLREAVLRLNPDLTPQDAQEVLNRLLALERNPSLEEANLAFHQCLTEGVLIHIRDGDSGQERGLRARLVDWDGEGNVWRVVRQLPIRGRSHRRPDVILYLNGLPVVLVELKRPNKPYGSLQDAWNQLQTYKEQIGALFVYNEVLICADGKQARHGSLTAGWDRFMTWKRIEADAAPPADLTELEVLTLGLLRPPVLLDYMRGFVLFEADRTVTKKCAAYHQYFAVNRAVARTVEAVKDDHKAGVVWHTQGSGKSVSMAWFAARVRREPSMQNPTLLVLTDRVDLDDQLFGQFARAVDLRLNPQQAASRLDLRALLNTAGGGVIFATIQKFSLTDDERARSLPYPLLSARSNIVVIADEAHRSQYGFGVSIDPVSGAVSSGMAANLRYGLPNATMIGFTGTPLELDDRSTPEVFGPYIDVYSVSRAVEDGATVPIYYEARLASLDLPEEERAEIDEGFDELTEDMTEAQKDKLQRRWTALERLVTQPKRVKLLARNMRDHWSERKKLLGGKGMIVCISRVACAMLYRELCKLEPSWHDPDPARGRLKVVFNTSSDDDKLLQLHHTSRDQLKEIERRYKDADSDLDLVIVCDMWLTGFDVPPLHTMYLDKPIKGHTLMQAIARVNRVWGDKPGGLVVDYLGVAVELRKAIRWYDRGDQEEQVAEDVSARAKAELERQVDVVHGLFGGYDYRGFFSREATLRLRALTGGAEVIAALRAPDPDPTRQAAQEAAGLDGKTRYRREMARLNKLSKLALHLCPDHALRGKIGYFQAVQATLSEYTVDEGLTRTDKDSAMGLLISQHLAPGDTILNLYEAAGIERPDLSVLSEEFLRSVNTQTDRPNLQAEALRRLLSGQLRDMQRHNVTRAGIFSDKLHDALNRYQNRSLSALQVVQELIAIARAMRAEQDRGQSLGLSWDELAFYDALTAHEGVREVMSDEVLAAIAHDLVDQIRASVTIDWSQKESVRARMRAMIKRLLRRHGYPPDRQEAAVARVLEQVEVSCVAWEEAL